MERGSTKTKEGSQVSRAQLSPHPHSSGRDKGPGGLLCLPSPLTTKPQCSQDFGINTQTQTGRTDGQVATSRQRRGGHETGSQVPSLLCGYTPGLQTGWGSDTASRGAPPSPEAAKHPLSGGFSSSSEAKHRTQLPSSLCAPPQLYSLFLLEKYLLMLQTPVLSSVNLCHVPHARITTSQLFILTRLTSIQSREESHSYLQWESSPA